MATAYPTWAVVCVCSSLLSCCASWLFPSQICKVHSVLANPSMMCITIVGLQQQLLFPSCTSPSLAPSPISVSRSLRQTLMHGLTSMITVGKWSLSCFYFPMEAHPISFSISLLLSLSLSPLSSLSLSLCSSKTSH